LFCKNVFKNLFVAPTYTLALELHKDQIRRLAITSFLDAEKNIFTMEASFGKQLYVTSHKN